MGKVGPDMVKLRDKEEKVGPSSPNKRKVEGEGSSETDEGSCEDDEGSSEENDETISVTLDRDILNCPSCSKALSRPVFQCHNGHIACSSCSTKASDKYPAKRAKNQCHSCYLQIGRIRCLAIERVIESIKIPCRHANYGCKEILSYSEKSTHEELCEHAPCRCPISDCKFVGKSKSLLLHFSGKHKTSTARFKYNCPFQVCLGKYEPLCTLHGEDGCLFLLVNNRNEHEDHVVFLTGVEPSSPKGGYAFKIVVREGGRSLQLQSFTVSVRMRPEVAPSRDHLVVPCNFCTSHEKLKVEVCIGSTREQEQGMTPW